MEINEGKGITISQDITPTQSRKSVDSEFRKIMEQAIQAGDKKAAAKANVIDPLFDGVKLLTGTEGKNKQSLSSEKQVVINELQETMDLVDFYVSKLADPSKPLSTIDPLIGHLEQRLENLKTIESAPGIPDQLKPIISDMVITIGTEITKYKSGIYS